VDRGITQYVATGRFDDGPAAVHGMPGLSIVAHSQFGSVGLVGEIGEQVMLRWWILARGRRTSLRGQQRKYCSSNACVQSHGDSIM
jgi:hypothetical protein